MPTSNKNQTLEGKEALIVGASSGIGLGCAEALLRAGATVTIAARNKQKLISAAEQLRKLPNIGDDSLSWLTCDAYQEEQVIAAINHSAEKTGRVDIVVCVAGGEGHGGPIHLMEQHDFEQTLVFGAVPAFLLLKHCAPLMMESGGGSVIAISSIAATMINPFMGAYSAGKAALEAMIKAAADELGAFNIRVNAIRPGFIPADSTSTMTASNYAQYIEGYIDQQSLKIVGDSAAVAGAVRFLASDDSSWITGQCINVDGGLHRIPKWDRAAMGFEIREEWLRFKG